MTGAILAKQFALNYLTLDRNLDGISHEHSLVRPTRGGNCINWVVGHILSTRNAGHQLLGIPLAWEDPIADRYKRGSKPMIDAAEAVGLETLVALCRTSQGALNGALLSATEDDFEREVEDKPADRAQRLSWCRDHCSATKLDGRLLEIVVGGSGN